MQAVSPQQILEQPKSTIMQPMATLAAPYAIVGTPDQSNLGMQPVSSTQPLSDAPVIGQGPSGYTRGLQDSFMPERMKDSSKNERNRSRKIISDLIGSSLDLREKTEGNSKTAYNDAGGIAIGQGLNLTVQDPESLQTLVGGNRKLYDKLSPYLGKKYNDLTPADKKQLVLSDKEVKALNSSMAKAALDATSEYGGNLSTTGKGVLADLQHWAGTAGLLGNGSIKLSIRKDNETYNPIAEVINNPEATDKDLVTALKIIRDNTNKNFVKSRVNKLLDALDTSN